MLHSIPRVVRWLLAAILIVMPAAAFAQSALSELPALDCAHPDGIAAVICADPDLPAQHRALRTLVAAAPPDAAQGLGGEAWMRHLREQCSTESVRACLLYNYFITLKFLAVDALFRMPEPALAALRLVEPRYHPVYEAIYRYNTIDDERQRTETVAQLIAPILEELRADPVIAPAFKDVPDARAAAATDKTFAAFLNEAAVRDLDLTMPCAAIARRPGLAAVFDPPPDGVNVNNVGARFCPVLRPGTRTRPLPAASTATIRKPLDCQHPDGLDALICADPELPAQEQAINTLLAAVRLDVFGSGPSQQDALQRKRLEARDEHCMREPRRACLIGNSYYRLKDVAVAALFRTPDTALPALRRVDPKTAPIYEAIYRYAVVDDPAMRAADVKRLIVPIFDAIHESPEGGIAPFSRLASADAAVASDDSFSLFLGAAAVSGYAKILPCDALMKRPGLIKALGPFYGGARDGLLPNADCHEMLPSLPVLDQLALAAPRAQPSCTGSIRFSVGRDFERILLALRLHGPPGWGPTTTQTAGYVKPVEESEARFRSEQGALIDRAKSEVAAYYVRFFKLGPDVAKADSDTAVETLVSNAFFHCGG
jgi:uncharacterized protein